MPSKCFEIFLQDVCFVIVFFLPYPAIQLIPATWENTRFDIAFSNISVLQCSLSCYVTNAWLEVWTITQSLYLDTW